MSEEIKKCTRCGVVSSPNNEVIEESRMCQMCHNYYFPKYMEARYKNEVEKVGRRRNS